MSAGTLSLSPQEAIARDRIVERVAARHHAPKAGRTRRHVRAALLLRSLAERLDPSGERAERAQRPGRAELHVVPAPRAGSPRPWAAAPRRAPHRHT